jgi:mRNA (guanine-N7-)-methyltransferase
MNDPQKMDNTNKTTPETHKNPKKDLESMVDLYLASNPLYRNDGKINELEVRFGTNTKLAKPISKIDYDNVIKKIYAAGFTTDNNDGLQILRIQNEYIDVRTGFTKVSNIRAEIVGLDLIQEYCKSNNIQKILSMTSSINAANYKVKFTQKTPPTKDGVNVRPVDFYDFNFRVSYQLEQDFTPVSNIAKTIIQKWSDSKKLFRLLNRVRFSHPDYPFFVDVSIVKGNKKVAGSKVPIPQYTIQDAGVFENTESYEVEIELDNTRIGISTPYDTRDKLLAIIRKGIRLILGAIQGSNYPISFEEKETVLQSMMKTIHGKEYQPRRVFPKDFIGPSSFTLQMENIVENTDNLNIPNIRKNYSVTDKADGERKLLYISDNGRIYLVDTMMNVVFTGTMTNEKTLFNSLLDGEHIKYDKSGKNINLFAAFDIYFVNNISVRELAFMKIAGEEDELDNKYRLLLLIKSMSLIKPYSVMDTVNKKTGELNEGSGNHSCDFVIKNKEFYVDSENITIFQGCSTILSNIKDGIYEYNTDGLIFTPCNTGVGSNSVGKAGRLGKITWDMSFKWKPSEFNTIDFLVSVKKDKNGKDDIHNIFQDGKNLTEVQTIKQYKTLILRCGFNEKEHGFLNAFQDLIDDTVVYSEYDDNEEKYKPVPFQPTNPYDEKACFCNVLLHDNGKDNYIMKSEEGEYFEESMIVEFKYDPTLELGWKWIPLRVRYDKTAELRSGQKNYGNAYHVANNNWQSIHNPITEEMISSGNGIPDTVMDSDVYYNRFGNESTTRGLRNFHNLYVKKKLIMSVAEKKHSLIDYAVGKGGDLPKWIQAKLGYVFGIDISKDNIQNGIDGACARYLKDKKKFKQIFGAMFLHGNSANNIRNGDAFATEKEKMIAKAVFGNGAKDRKKLGEAVYKSYGIGQDGFHISSCQFALHYFFENASVLNSFLQNVAECTKLGGYFIGTCYDGKKVFELMKEKLDGESISIYKGSKKVFEMTKLYSQTGFPDDSGSIGYPVNIFQESINKVFREYLVNFDYLLQIMEDYGFVLITKEESDAMGLPSGSGYFEELYNLMKIEVESNPRKKNDYGEAYNMTVEEKTISFLNRYFIFKKVRTVNTDKISKILNIRDKEEGDAEDEDEKRDATDVLEFSEKLVEKQTKLANKIDEANKPTKISVKKIKKTKFVIDNYSPILDSPVAQTEEPVVTEKKVVEPVLISKKPIKIKVPRKM